MATIHQTYRIEAPLERVWESLVDPATIQRWSGQKAVMDDQVGTEFSLWGGDVTGKNVRVEVLSELVQEWRLQGWQTPSLVTLRLKQDNNLTLVELLHENVPEKSKPSIDRGWHEYFLGAIKELLEA